MDRDEPSDLKCVCFFLIGGVLGIATWLIVATALGLPIGYRG